MSARSESFFLKSQGPFSVWPQPSPMQMKGVVSQGPTGFSAGHRPPSVLPGLVFPCCSRPFRFSLHVVEEAKRNTLVFGLSQLLTIPQPVGPCFSFCCRFSLGSYKPGRNKRELVLGSLLPRVSCWYRGLNCVHGAAAAACA